MSGMLDRYREVAFLYRVSDFASLIPAAVIEN